MPSNAEKDLFRKVLKAEKKAYKLIASHPAGTKPWEWNEATQVAWKELFAIKYNTMSADLFGHYRIWRKARKIENDLTEIETLNKMLEAAKMTGRYRVESYKAGQYRLLARSGDQWEPRFSGSYPNTFQLIQSLTR